MRLRKWVSPIRDSAADTHRFGRRSHRWLVALFFFFLLTQVGPITETKILSLSVAASSPGTVNKETIVKEPVPLTEDPHPPLTDMMTRAKPFLSPLDFITIFTVFSTFVV